MRTSVLTLVAASLVIAACSAGDDADVTVAPTLADTTPTTADTTTTTTSESTTPPTSAPAIDQAAQQQAVIDAALASWEAFNEAKLDPTNEAKLDRIVDLHNGALEARMVEVIGNFRVLNQASRTNEALPAEIVVDRESVVVREGTATVEFCEVNSNVLVEVGAGPNGVDAIIDDSTRTVVSRLVLQLSEDNWIAVEGERVRSDDEATTCDG
jgi:hypothetical protein